MTSYRLRPLLGRALAAAKRWPLRYQLMGLVLVVALPLSTLVIMNLYANVRHSQESAYLTVRNVAQDLKLDTEMFLANSKSRLELLAARPLIKAMDPNRCDPVIVEIQKLLPEYAVVVLRDIDGKLVCGDLSQPGPWPASVADLEWFREGKTRADFTVSKPLFGRVTGKWISVLTYPVRGDQRQVLGLLILTIDLKYFKRMADIFVLPPGSIIALIDRDGTFIMHSADPARVGQRFRDNEITDVVLRSDRGEAKATGTDAIERIYSYGPIAGAGWHAYAGIPSDIVMAPALAAAIEGTLIAAGLLVVIFGLGFLIARNIEAPLRAIGGVASEIARGNLAVRAALDGSSEIAQVATQFNAMLDARQIAEQQLRRSETLLNETQALAKVGGWEYDVASTRMRWTDEVFRIFELSRDYDPSDLRQNVQLYPAGERARLAKSFQRAVEQGDPYDIELECVTGSGRKRWIRSVAQAMRRDGRVVRVYGNIIDITKRKYAAEAQARLAAIVESSYDAIIGRAMDGTFAAWNAAAERMLGYTAAEVIGRHLNEFQPPELSQEAAERRKQLLTGLAAASYETVRVTKDGRRIDVAISGSAIKDESGNIIGTAAVLRDITERKRAERELRHKTELAQLLEQLARAANEAVSPQAAMETCLARICEHGRWELGRVVTFRPTPSHYRAAYSQWFCPEPARFDTFMRFSDGYAHDPVAGLFFSRVLRDKIPVWLSDMTVLDTRESGRIVRAVEAGLKEGFAFPVIVKEEVVAALEFFDAETREPDVLLMEGTSGLASQFARMIERSAAEETRARLAAIVENSYDAIMSRALDGTITAWNAAAERMLGYTSAEVIGREMIELQPPELRQESAERRDQVLAGQTGVSWETERIAKDGRRIDVAVGVSAVKDSNNQIIGTAVILRDITERKRAERELQHKTELAQLLEQLARTANEAVSPEIAMETCLARICDYGKFALGRVATFRPAQSQRKPEHTHWFCTQPARFDTFMRYTDNYTFKLDTGEFFAVVVRTHRPVWLPDLTAFDPATLYRLAVAVEAGLKMAFAFPVIVRGDVAAVLEFFADEARAPDALLMEGTSGLASQFARMIERSAADKVHAYLAAIVETSSDAIISRGLDGTINSWNAAAERILGYTAAETIGRHMFELEPPEMHQEIAERRRQLLAGQSVAHWEEVRIAKDGRRIPMLVSGSVVKDSSGNIVGVAAILREITERKRAERELQDYAKRLQGLSRRLVDIEEGERRKINRELHDRVGQSLGALNIRLNIIRSQLSQESLRAISADFEKAQTLLAETAAHARNVMADLRPPGLDDYGLLAALCSYVDSVGAHVVVPITLRGEDISPRLSPAVEMALFRIAQGAIANAVQHARAKRIEVVLDATPEWVTLTIADDGAGFDPEGGLPTRQSWGLTIMRERAEGVGAELTVESAPGNGTRVCVEVDRLADSNSAMNAEEHE